MKIISQLVQDRATDSRDRVFLRFNDVDTTFGDLHAGVQKTAGALLAAGVRRGDRVGLMLNSSLDHIELFLATAWIGAVVVPFSVHFRAAGLELQMRSSRPHVLVANGAHDETIRTATALVSEPPKVVWLDAPENLASGEAVLATYKAMANPVIEPVLRDLADDIIISYTSGTTGAPKGGVLSEQFFYVGAKNAGLLSEAKRDDVFFLWEPFYHVAAWMTVLIALQHGLKIHMVERFSASRLWDQIRAAGATKFHYLGGLINIILAQPARPDDRDNPVVVAWGAACPLASWKTFEDRFGVKIREGYGLTEAQNFTHINLGPTIGSIGRPVEELESWIVDDAGQKVGPGVTGELILRGKSPGVGMTGYWGEPEKTAMVLREDGTIHTGDLAMMDEDGNYYFKGRKKDAMRRRGENVSAWEVERVINAAPNVEESAVVGVDADVGEQEILAVIKLHPGATADPAAIIRHAADQLAYYQVPRFIQFVDEFPRGPTQRIKKNEIQIDLASLWDAEKHDFKPSRKV